MERMLPGVVVARPTLPAWPDTVRKGVWFEEEAMWKRGLVCPAVPARDSLAKGEVVPMPMEPAKYPRPLSRKRASVVEALFTSSNIWFVPVPAPQTENCAAGVVVPRETLLVLVAYTKPLVSMAKEPAKVLVAL